MAGRNVKWWFVSRSADQQNYTWLSVWSIILNTLHVQAQKPVLETADAAREPLQRASVSHLDV